MSEKKEGRKNITSRWEWVAAALSGIIVAGTLIVLAMGAARNDEHPRFTTRADTVIARDDGYLARVTVTNHGTETAADLVVEAALSGAGRTIETSTVTLDYVPGRAERTVGFFFSTDPRTGTLRVRAQGYKQP